LSVIYALWLRQLKRFVRTRARIIATFGQPILYLVAFGFGFGPVFRKAGQGNYIQFLAPGIIAMTILFNSVLGGIELMWDRQIGFLKETLVAPVRRRLVMFGRILGGATVAIMQGLMVTAVFFIAGFRPASVGGFLFGLVFMALIGMLFTAFGTGIATRIPDFQVFQLIMNFLVMPLFFLSGALFPLKDVPRALQRVASLDPFAYGVDGLRSVLSSEGAHWGTQHDFITLLVLTLIMIAVSSRLFTTMEG
jgi:ABC-2 type transport system permease protein